MKNEYIEFLKSIRNKLNEEEQIKLDEILEHYLKYKKSKVKYSESSRKNSKYLTEVNKIRVKLRYNKKVRNFEKIKEYEKLLEELCEKHKQGLI